VVPNFLVPLDLNKNELRQAAVQNLTSAPPTPVKGQLWYDSTNNILKWWDGTSWQQAMAGAGMSLSSSASTQAIGDAPVGGVSSQASAGDHKHGMPAFGGSVTAETSYGLASNVGAATTIARSDHTHGTPAASANTKQVPSTWGTITTSGAAAVDTSYLVTVSANITITLPTTPASGSAIGFIRNDINSANTVIVSCGGADLFRTSGSTGGGTGNQYNLLNNNEMLVFVYNAGFWHLHGQSLPPAGTANQVLTKNSITPYDVIWATPAAGVSPATTVQTEAVADAGQVGTAATYAREDHRHPMPATFPPSGTAGGDLAGSTYPNPVIANGAVTSAKILDGTIATTDLAFTPIQSGGAAGGALTGTYPNPTLANNSVSSANITDGTIVVADTATAFDLGALATAHPTSTDVALNNHKITGLLDPAAAQDGATKNYVDNTVQGLDAKQSVKAASTANLTLSGTQTVDGIALIANDRVLCKDQTTVANNGIYVVAAGAWVRATDMDAWTEVPSAYTWVEQGTVNGDTGWLCTADQGGTLNTTAVTWTQFSGAAQINAGNGLTKTGNTIDFVTGDTSLTVAADSVIVNTAVIATVASVTTATTGMVKKYASALAGSVAYATGEVFLHNLNTRDIQVSVINNNSPWNAIEVDWEATDTTHATIRYNSNVINPVGYRVVITG
jgi:hypothetical protein